MAANPFSQDAQAGGSAALQDPSVTAAASGSSDADAAPSNPFLNTGGATSMGQVQMGFPGDNQFPGESAGGSGGFPGEPSGGGGFSGGGGGASSGDLDKKRAELEAWEARLRQREAALAEGGGDGDVTLKSNWPPCCPFARNDINGDFGEGVDPLVQANRPIVTWGYRILLSNFVLLFWNLICMCAYATGGDANTDKFEAVGVSIAYVIFGFPGAFYMWYRVLYIACQSRRASYYFIAMCTFMIQCLFWLVATCGFPGTNMAGLWIGIQQFDRAGDASDDDKGSYEATGIFCLVQFGLALLHTCISFWIWFEIRKLYQGSGGADQAKGEAVQDAASNKAVQDAAMAQARGQFPGQ